MLSYNHKGSGKRSRRQSRKQSSRKSSRRRSKRNSKRNTRRLSKKKSKTKSSIKKRKKLEKYKLKKINNNIKIKKKLKGGNKEWFEELKTKLTSLSPSNVTITKTNESENQFTFSLTYENTDSTFIWKNITLLLKKGEGEEDYYVYIYWGPTDNPCVYCLIHKTDKLIKKMNIDDFFYNRKGNLNECNGLFNGVSKSIEKVSIGIVGMSLMVYLGLLLDLDEIWLEDVHSKSQQKKPTKDCTYYTTQFNFIRFVDDEIETNYCFLDLSTKYNIYTDYIHEYSKSKEHGLYKSTQENKKSITIKASQFQPLE